MPRNNQPTTTSQPQKINKPADSIAKQIAAGLKELFGAGNRPKKFVWTKKGAVDIDTGLVTGQGAASEELTIDFFDVDAQVEARIGDLEGRLAAMDNRLESGDES